MAQMLNPADGTTHVKGRVQALHDGHLIADSETAVRVAQAGGPEIYYFPKADVEMAVLRPTDHTAEHCGLGRARYWTIYRDAQVEENGAWSFENPAPANAALAGMIAFQPGLVDIHLVTGGGMMDRQAQAMSDYIRHTDSGSGRSQEEHWAPTAGLPDPEAGELDEDDPRV